VFSIGDVLDAGAKQKRNERHHDTDPRSPGKCARRASDRLALGKPGDQQFGALAEKEVGRSSAGRIRLASVPVRRRCAGIPAIVFSQVLVRGIRGFDRPHEQNVSGGILVHARHYRGEAGRCGKRPTAQPDRVPARRTS
jgi:hypothetical protein